MNRSLALSIIGVSDEQDDVHDLWDDFLFQLKHKILISKLATPLLSILLKKTLQAVSVEATLFTIQNAEPFALPVFNQKDVVLRFNAIQKSLSYAKLVIQQSNTGLGLDDGLKVLYQSVKAYEDFVIWITSDIPFKHKETMKIADVIDVMYFHKELQTFVEKREELSLHSQNLNTFEKEFDAIWHESSRIQLYYNRNEIAQSEK